MGFFGQLRGNNCGVFFPSCTQVHRQRARSNRENVGGRRVNTRIHSCYEERFMEQLNGRGTDTVSVNESQLSWAVSVCACVCVGER